MIMVTLCIVRRAHGEMARGYDDHLRAVGASTEDASRGSVIPSLRLLRCGFGIPFLQHGYTITLGFGLRVVGASWKRRPMHSAYHRGVLWCAEPSPPGEQPAAIG
jgi:hypothetical protein